MQGATTGPMELALAWLKGLHVAGLVIWTAGLLYLTSMLFAHEGVTRRRRFVRLRRGSRFNYTVVASPGGFLAIGAGTGLLLTADVLYGWMFLKLAMVGVLVGVHLYLGFVLERLTTPEAEPPRAALAVVTLLSAAAIGMILWLVLAEPHVPTGWIPEWLVEPGFIRALQQA